MTLALDTTTEFGSIALVSGDAITAEVRGHMLYDHLRTLLDGAGCRLDEIDCFRGASPQACHAGFRAGISNS